MKNLIQDVKPRKIISAYVDAPFDISLKILKENNYRLISLEENAKLRIQEGKDAFCSIYGNWVQEDFVYIPKKGFYLTKDYSPICENAEQATTRHKNKQEFYLTNEQVEKSLVNSILLPKDAESLKIPTNDFKNNKITNYFFGSSAENYGKFLGEYGINNISISFAHLKDKSFARKIWFNNLNNASKFFCDCGLHYRAISRGVKK